MDQTIVFLLLALLSVVLAVVAIGVSNFADHCAGVCAGERAIEDQMWWLALQQRAFAVVVTALIFAVVLLCLTAGSLLLKTLAT